MYDIKPMYAFCQDFFLNIMKKNGFFMNFKNAFIKGTLLLTFAGLFSRFMGFFYRIFLANTIGAEGMGIYQLIFPIYSVCFSLCASGIETAVSKLTSAKYACGNVKEVSGILKAGLFLTLTLSISCSLFIFYHAEHLANVFLKEPRCTELLKILAFTIPFGTTQSCICGYYFGIHKAAVPSFAQLIEQGVRILSVFLLYKIYTASHTPLTPVIAVLGMVFGEFFSLLFTITCFSFYQKKLPKLYTAKLFSHAREILTLSTPLTVSRICINLLASLEATLIPNALKSYGMNTASALSVYGTLTGMALPFILFPTAFTGSLSLMLLPKVSEFQASGQTYLLKDTTKKTFVFCFTLGFSCLAFFLLSGNFLGTFVFSSTLAGSFIQTLSWICPFLYLNTTLNSILNGLGRTDITFFTGICSIFLRIAFIFWGVPILGIQGYLWGLLVSQLFISVFSCTCLYRFFKNQ